jgi:hypothetical protein
MISYRRLACGASLAHLNSDTHFASCGGEGSDLLLLSAKYPLSSEEGPRHGVDGREKRTR